MSSYDLLSTTWQVHFRCVFDLQLLTPGPDPWTTLVKTVRAWVKEKEQSPEITTAIGRRWFFEGDRHAGIVDHRRVAVETRRLVGNGSVEEPECWAVRYEHSDNDPKAFRTWRTDVAVQALGDSSFRFSVQVTNSLHPGFVGPEPVAPTPSAPKLVTRLLTSTHWHATAGSAVLRAVPEVLTVGDGARLLARLGDSERRCPLLLLSGDPATGQSKLDAGRLARVLAGTAQVVIAADSELSEELRYLLPYSLRCSGGTVRLYLPGVRLESAETDYRRHRFVRATEIDEASPGIVEDRFVSAVARRLPVGFRDVLWGIDDVQRRDRDARFATLRAQLAASADRELLQLFEDDNIALQKDNRDLKATLEQREDELDEANGRAARLAFQRDTEHNRAEVAEAESRALRTGHLALSQIALPTNVGEVIDWVTALWGDRVVFTERARKSAAKAGINRDRGELPVVWQILRSLAVDLHPLLEKDSSGGGTISDHYRQRSGFELTWTEGKQTKKDNKLMQSRQIEHQGQLLDITPHVKYGSKSPKCLRVHFAVEEGTGTIIVGHCGDHLDTYGTQRMD